MYAVIRAGGKQYRVSPGDVLRVEKQVGAADSLDFELLAVGDNGKISRPQGEARVVGQVVGEGREKKILVFHYKRKKQYKKLNGHRQPFTTVRIAEITFDGQTAKAPESQVKAAKAAKPKAKAEPVAEAAPKKSVRKSAPKAKK
jgi:large subunit ribosomal protein L21